MHQIRTHPSVSWDHIRSRSKGGEIICADVDHVVIVVHNGTLFVDTVTIDSHNVARTVVELKKDDKAARRMAIEARNVHENHLCPSCLLEHWTYVLTKYNSRFGLRFLDLPATLALLDAKARGEVAVGV